MKGRSDESDSETMAARQFRELRITFSKHKH